MSNKIKVLVSFPMAPGHPYMHKFVSTIQWNLAKDFRYNVIPMWPVHSPFENNLHLILLDFLKSDCMFWLSIDCDNPPLKNPLDLIQYNRDIIGLTTPVWHFTGKDGERPFYWTGYDYHKETDSYIEHKEKKGLQLVDAIGTGCFLMHRRVFLNRGMQEGPFLRKWLKSGVVYKGNDMAFCERAKKHGFEIYCSYDYYCDHIAILSMHEIMEAFISWSKKSG